MDESVEKLASVWYEQGQIIGLGIRDALFGDVKEASSTVGDDLRKRFGLKTASETGVNYGGTGDANPTEPPATPSNDSDVKSESSDVVKDEKAAVDLPEGELAQGAVGVTATAKEASAANLFDGAFL